MKRLIIFSISVLAFAVAWLGERFARLAGRKIPGRCVVIYYHSVPASQRANFARQMDDLLRIAEPLPADWAGPLPEGKRFAVVTFDDGYRNNLSNAFPEMKSRGIPATLFIAPEMLGSPTNMHDGSASSPVDREIISAAELKKLAGDFITIGSHSLSHPHIAEINAEEAARELFESRKILEEMLQRPIRLFCFPFGCYNQELLRMCREAGYERVFTTRPGWALAEPNEFVSGRTRVDPTDARMEFRLKLLGAYHWLPGMFALKRRILRRRPEHGDFAAVASN